VTLRSILAAGAIASALLGCAFTANASVLYQSIPDLTAAPSVNAWCDQCGDGQNIGQHFTIDAASVATSVNLVVDSAYVWPTTVTLDIFADGGSNTLGANLFHQVFGSYASDTPTGNGTDVVGFNLGSLNLAVGAYDLWLVGANFGMPGFVNSGGQIAQFPGVGVGPQTGDSYEFVSQSFNGTPYDGGVQVLGNGVPEPATWGLMILGFGGIGATLRRRRTFAVTA
jgi:PEP-CTERM motif